MATFVTFLFFVSGVVALAYEVVWVRALGLVVGNSLWAAIVVVAAYMGGMALGSAAVARFAGRMRHHVRLYGVAEVLAALVALATQPVLAVLARVAAHLGPTALGGWGWSLMGRFAVAALFLAVPTIAMGATLPLLVARVATSQGVGFRVGRLYAANTLGAVFGVVLAGFAGLPNLGESGTLSAAAAVGLVVGVAAWFVEGVVPPAAKPPERTAGSRSLDPWLAFPAFFGFTALAAELVWTRILLLHLGSRVYAFALILAVYLAGIAVGSAVGRRWSDCARPALALCQLLVSLSLAAQVLFFAHFGDLLGWLTVRLKPVGFSGLQLTLALAVTIVLFPPTLAFGASFPLSVAAHPGAGPGEARTGAVSAANTSGAVVGTIVAPLVLVPLLGTQWVLFGMAILSALVAAVLATANRPRLVALVIAAAIALVAPFVAPGTVLRGAAVVSEGVAETVSESASATVVVRRITDARGEWRSLELNGVNVAGTSVELRAIQRLQGHLPLLLASNPQTVLHIGFGSGGTAWAVSRHPVKEIVIAEISPEVLAVSDSVFRDINHGVLGDPRVRVILNDGRNVLLATREKFDAILSDSIHPVYAGNSTLYTREYFQMCRDHLRPGGVVSMWLPMYSLTQDAFLGILRAFWEVFPGTCVWYDPVMLNEFTVVTGVASAEPVRVDWRALHNPALAATLKEAAAVTPGHLAAMLMLGPREVADLVSEAPAHVDDFPTVEYRSGRVLDRDGAWLSNLRILWAARTRTFPFADLPLGYDYRAIVALRDRTVAAQMRELRARTTSP